MPALNNRMPNSSVQTWLSIHRELVAREAAFTDLAISAANGGLSMDELDRHRKQLIGLRQRCADAYEHAFRADMDQPKAVGNVDKHP